MLGAGVEVAAACDVRLPPPMRGSACPEVARRALGGGGGAAAATRSVAAARATVKLLTGDTIDAVTANAWGLVEEIVPQAAGLDAAVERRPRPSSWPPGPRAVRFQKALIAEWEDLPLRQAVQRGIDQFPRLRGKRQAPRLLMEDISRARPIAEEEVPTQHRTAPRSCHCERSGAISIRHAHRDGDCVVAALLATGQDRSLALPAWVELVDSEHPLMEQVPSNCRVGPNPGGSRVGCSK